MTNLITRYLEHKKKYLTSCALVLSAKNDYKEFQIECINKYINNYIEVFYHKAFETLGEKTILDENAIQIEQEGMRLELLDKLQAREIIESNTSFTEKKEIIENSKQYAYAVISLEQETKAEKEELINQKLIELSSKVEISKTAYMMWKKKMQEEEKVINKLLEESIFTLNQIPYQENLWELTLLNNIKQVNVYKQSLVKRVEKEIKVEKEKLKLVAILTNQIILNQIIKKEKIGNYILPIQEEIWQDKERIEEILNLFDDKILKEHIYLGISYNLLNSNKHLREKKKLGYQFACYQDFTHILDIANKINTIDASGLFDYLIITGYKAKDVSTIEKEEPSIIKEIFFRKVR